VSGSLRAVLILGASAPLRSERARAVVDEHTGESGLALWSEGDPSRWPLVRDPRPALAEPAALLVEGVEAAFPDHQSGGNRLVLTQSSYQMQRLVDRLDEHGCLLVVTADAAALERKAPEALRGRGPWRRFERIDLGETAPEALSPVRPEPKNELEGLLRLAFSSDDPTLRWDACRRAAALDARSPVVKLCFASAAMEVDRTDAAKDALEQAAKAAPEWEAVHYERGKLFLRTDEMEQAERAFARAVECMPSFVSALANWGGDARRAGPRGRGRPRLRARARARSREPAAVEQHGRAAARERAARGLGGGAPARDRARPAVRLRTLQPRSCVVPGRALRCVARRVRRGPAPRPGPRATAVGPPGAGAEMRAEALEVVTALLALKPELEQGRTVLELLRGAPARGGA